MNSKALVLLACLVLSVFCMVFGAGGALAGDSPAVAAPDRDAPAPPQFRVVFQTDGTSGTTLIGQIVQSVGSNTDCSPVTAVPAAGYRFAGWTLEGADYSPANPLTVHNVTRSMTFVAQFQLWTDFKGRVGVVNLTAGGLQILDSVTQMLYGPYLAGTFESGGDPTLWDAAVTPDNQTVLVSNLNSDRILFVDTSNPGNPTLLPSPLTLPIYAEDIAFTPDGKYALVSGSSDTSIAIINVLTRALIQNVPTPHPCNAVAVAADGQTVLTVDHYGKRLDSFLLNAALGTLTNTATIDVSPFRPINVEFSPDGRTGIVVSYNSSTSQTVVGAAPIILRVDAPGTVTLTEFITLPPAFTNAQSVIFSRHAGDYAYYYTRHQTAPAVFEGDILQIFIHGPGEAYISGFIPLSSAEPSNLFGVDSLAADPAGRYLYASGAVLPATVAVVDLMAGTEVTNLSTPATPRGVAFSAFDPSFSLSYSAGSNGIVTGVAHQIVGYGDSGSPVMAVAAGPGGDYVFVKWSDGSTANPRTDTYVVADVDVTALFAPRHLVEFQTDGTPGAALIGDAIQLVFDGEDSLPVTAAPPAAYRFVKWTRDDVDYSQFNPLTDHNVTEPATFVAHFEPWANYTGQLGVVSLTTHGLQLVDPATATLYGPFLTELAGSGGDRGLFDAVLTRDGKTALVSSFSTHQVFFVDLSVLGSATLATSLTLPIPPEDIALTPDGRFALVTDGGTSSQQILVIDMASRTIAQDVITSATGTYCQAVAVGSDGRTVLTVDYINRRIDSFLLDPDSGALAHTASIDVRPFYPINVDFSADGKTAIVATAGSTSSTLFGACPLVLRVDSPGAVTFMGHVPLLPVIGFAQSVVFSRHAGARAYYFANRLASSVSHAEIEVLDVTGPGIVTFSGTSIPLTTPSSVTSYFGIDTIAIEPSGRYLFVSAQDYSADSSLVMVDLLTNMEVATAKTYAMPATYPRGVGFSAFDTTRTLSYSAGPNGSLLGAPRQTVFYGDSGTTVTVVPHDGYRFVQWSDGSTANPRVDTHVTANINVTAVLAQETGTVVVAVTPATAPWSFTDGGGGLHSGVGPTAGTPAAPGQIALTWLPLPGYETPANPAPQALTAGTTVTFTAAYTPLTQTDFAITHVGWDLQDDGLGDLLFTPTPGAAKSTGIAIKRLKKTPAAPSAKPGVTFVKTWGYLRVGVGGDLGAFYSDAPVASFVTSGTLGSVATKDALIGAIVADRIGSVRMARLVDSTAAAPQFAETSIASLGSATSPALQVSLTGIILRDLGTGQPVKSLSVATKKFVVKATKKAGVALGGVGRISPAAANDAVDEFGVTAAAIASLSAKGADLRPDRIASGADMPKIEATALALGPGNVIGGTIGSAANPTSLTVTAPNLGTISGAAGVHGAFFAGVNHSGGPDYSGAIGAITTRPGGTLSGEAYVKENLIKFLPPKGDPSNTMQVWTLAAPKM